MGKYKNSLGQTVVDTECGYKIYDADREDAIILRVGDMRNGKYVYIDKEPILNGTSDICFMSSEMLSEYEIKLKNITCLNASDEEILQRIIMENIECGIRASEIFLSAIKAGKEPMDFFEEFIEKILE